MLRLRTFGGCFLERDGTRLDGLSGQRKGLALLALLASAGETGISRDAAATALWPESDEERAAASLKQLVHSIRQQLGSSDVVLGPATLRLNSALAISDVGEFKAALLRGDHESAVALYEGPFLSGFFLRGADTFERWVTDERSSLAASHAAALETLASRTAAGGDARRAVEWWRRAQAADPLSGRVAVGLMRALDAAGDRAGALRHARIHEALLLQEVGSASANPQVSALAVELASAPPAHAATAVIEHERTEARVQAIAAPFPSHAAPRRARPRWVAPALAALLVAAVPLGFAVWPGEASESTPADAPAVSAVDRRAASGASIVVLPFANTSGDSADEPFAVGLTDELIGALGQVSGLRVVPRTSAFALKGKGLDVRTMADTLGVVNALEGSVRRAGDRLRITVTLVNAPENRVMWSETYDRDAKDVFAVQREIAGSVLRALQITRDARPDAQSVTRVPLDHVAYELYLKGQFFRTQMTDASLERSAAYFEQAIARDSGYARAYAGLADVRTLLVSFGDRAPGDSFVKARRAALTALALDSTLATAHAALAHIEMVHDWNWPSAGVRLERAMQLDSTVSTIRVLRSIWLLDQRRFDEAIALLERARLADPLFAAIRMTLGRIYVSKHEPERAIPFLRATLELNPQLALAHQQLGHALLATGQPTEAVAEFERAAVLSGVRDSAQLAYAYAMTGRRREAKGIVETLIQSSSERYLPPFGIAVAYAGLGDVDAAFRWLEKAFAERAAAMDIIAITTAFDPLHRDPRWADLMRRMGLPT